MLTILQGDALTKLRELKSESVQCCVTSPPYWGLRDYGTAQWEGGNVACDHIPDRSSGVASSTLDGGKATTNHQQEGWKGRDCGRCGANRIDSQLGLERTPEEYVAKMVQVFREVHRVLRKDGTLWLNLGDSYSSGGRGSYDSALVSKTSGVQNNSAGIGRSTPSWAKPKDLLGIPWRVAFALQTDGWWLRSDIIWAKPNPMPESVTDRPTKAHEYIFLLTKASSYFYDAEAIKEKAVEGLDLGILRSIKAANGQGPTDRASIDKRLATGIDIREGNPSGSRNKRSVWTIATQPYPEAHFATFPAEIPKLCILAGSRIGDTVLDPFAGSGTTGMVALELGRKAVLIELNSKYVALIEQRCTVTPGLALA